MSQGHDLNAMIIYKSYRVMKLNNKKQQNF